MAKTKGTKMTNSILEELSTDFTYRNPLYAGLYFDTANICTFTLDREQNSILVLVEDTVANKKYVCHGELQEVE